MRKWVIIGALAVEVERLRDELDLVRCREWAGTPIYRGQSPGGDDIVVFYTGAGKVRSAAATQFAIDTFAPTHILCVGAAGALSTDLALGEIVIADRVIEYDFDDRAFNPDGPPRSWDTDALLRHELASAARRVLGTRQRYGTVLTGDRVVCDPGERRALELAFQGDCGEMEGAAVTSTGSRCGVPVAVLRVISDFADRVAPISFADMLQRVGSLVAAVVGEVVLASAAAPLTVTSTASHRE
jgi:adenosylhomocysteine nucleosidase